MRPGGGFPPGDVVERMVLCYRAPALAYRHLRETGGLISYVVPELEARSVLESAVRVYLLLTRFTKSQAVDRLLEIAEGGVGQRERAEFNQTAFGMTRLMGPVPTPAVISLIGRTFTVSVFSQRTVLVQKEVHVANELYCHDAPEKKRTESRPQ